MHLLQSQAGMCMAAESGHDAVHTNDQLLSGVSFKSVLHCSCDFSLCNLGKMLGVMLSTRREKMG